MEGVGKGDGEFIPHQQILDPPLAMVGHLYNITVYILYFTQRATLYIYRRIDKKIICQVHSNLYV